MQKIAHLAATLLIALSLTACGQPSKLDFKNTDITGIDYAKEFSLPDANGTMRHLSDFKGKVVVLFFGYTQCPDVCPTTMAELATVMQELGALSDQVQVIFISLDPERDTKQIIKEYAPAFDKRFIGLVGDVESTKQVAKDFRIFYQKVPSADKSSYTIDHSAGSYVFDKEGHARLFVRFNQGTEPISHDLKLLLQ